MLSYDVIFKPNLLSQLLLRYPGCTVGVAEVKRMTKHKKLKRKKRSGYGGFAFWGVKGVFVFLVITVLHKFASALPVPHYMRSRSTIKRVSSFFRVPYELVEDVNDAQFVDRLKALRPDVIVSFQHQIFRQEILNVPKIACINCHPAKLPKYRGVKPIFWAMLEGDKEIGVTVHTMESEIDVGLIISQKCFPILENSTLMDNYIIAYSFSVDVILEALQMLEENRGLEGLQPIPPSLKYYKNPTKLDLNRFKSLGLKIV